MQFQVVSAAEASQVGGRPSVPPVILWLPRGGRAAQEIRKRHLSLCDRLDETPNGRPLAENKKIRSRKLGILNHPV